VSEKLQPNQLSLGELSYAFSEGPDNGPPLVLMHGLSGNQQTWNSVIPHLVDQYKLFTVDHRGHGLSSHHQGEYHVDSMVEDLTRFIEEVIGGHVFVVGHSMGGRIALKLAASHPSLTRAIILEDPPLAYGSSIEESRFVFEFWLELTRKNLSEEDMVREIANFNDNDDLEAARYKAQTLRQMDSKVLELALDKQLWPGSGFEEQFSLVQCPALLLQADTACGGVMDEDLSSMTELQAANWSWKRFPEAGHSIHAEMPESFAQMVHTFLQSGSLLFRS
jgi:pimeloyl-ACP methyl ester carboxylesterase